MAEDFKTNLGFPDLALALVTGSSTLVAERAVRLELALLLGDLAGSLGGEGRGEGEGSAGGGRGEVVTLYNYVRTPKSVYVTQKHARWSRPSWASSRCGGRR